MWKNNGIELDDCSEKRMLRTSIMRSLSFGCIPTNGSMVYVKPFTLHG